MSKDFNSNYLFKKSRKRNIAIKTLIMNANIVVGVGNIYASEALFLAKIRPQKISKKLTKKKLWRLIKIYQKGFEKSN